MYLSLSTYTGSLTNYIFIKLVFFSHFSHVLFKQLFINDFKKHGLIVTFKVFNIPNHLRKLFT